MHANLLLNLCLAIIFGAVAATRFDSSQSRNTESQCRYYESLNQGFLDIQVTIRNKTTPETGGTAKGLEDNLTPCELTGNSQYNFLPTSLGNGDPDYQVKFLVRNTTKALTCVENAILAAEKQNLLCVPVGLPEPGVTECAVIEAKEANGRYGQNLKSGQFSAIVQIHTKELLTDGHLTATPGSALGKSVAPCGMIGSYNPQLISSTDYYAQFTVNSNASTCIERAIFEAEKQNVTCSGTWGYGDG